jgi:hypothetical protein
LSRATRPTSLGPERDPAEQVAHFEGPDLDPATFHHADHVRMAWCYLRTLPLAETVGRFAEGLRRVAARAGRPDRYHETVTWAYVLIIHERMSADPELDWPDFADGNPDLFEWPGGALAAYYRPETLRSERARRTFVMPDRLGP